MKTEELRELDAWIAEHAIGWVVKSRQCEQSSSVTDHFWFEPGNDIKPKYESSTQRMFPSGQIVGDRCPKEIPRYTTDPAAAMEVLKKLHNEFDRQSCLASLHNFLMRKSHNGTLSELQICLFAKKIFTK